MSRRKGSKNVSPSFVSSDRMVRKSIKLLALLDEYVEISLRNGPAKRELDYNMIKDVRRGIEWLTKKEHY